MIAEILLYALTILTSATNRGSFNFLPSSVIPRALSKFSVKNIPGTTLAGTYQIEEAKRNKLCQRSASVNLKVERVGSGGGGDVLTSVELISPAGVKAAPAADLHFTYPLIRS